MPFTDPDHAPLVGVVFQSNISDALGTISGPFNSPIPVDPNEEGADTAQLPPTDKYSYLGQLYIYSIFNLWLFLSILFYNFFNLVLKRQTEMVNGTSIDSLLFLPFFFNESNAEGTNFRITFICFMFVKCACLVLYCFQLLKYLI